MKISINIEDVKKEYASLKKGLTDYIIYCVENAPDHMIDLDDVETPTFVYYDCEGDISEHVVDSVFLSENNELALDIDGDLVYHSEQPYLFDSIKWLISLCENIHEILQI